MIPIVLQEVIVELCAIFCFHEEAAAVHQKKCQKKFGFFAPISATWDRRRSLVSPRISSKMGVGTILFCCRLQTTGKTR